MSSLHLIESLQKSGFLVASAKIFSFLGNEEFFLLLLPLIYWLFDRKTGARLGVLLLFSAALNDVAKVAFASPRPFWFDSDLGRSFEASFGFPSGHAQNAVVVWGFLAARSRNPKVWLPLALALAVLIGCSRLTLGVHFPVDVLGGWLVGLALLGAWLWQGEKAMARARNLPLGAMIALSVLLVAVLGAAYDFAFHHPAITPLYASQLTSGRGLEGALFDASSGQSIVSRLGALFGLIVGLSLARHFEFRSQAPLASRIARFLIGFVGLAVFYFGLKKVFPADLSFRFARYALTTGWVSFGALWMFARIEKPEGRVV